MERKHRIRKLFVRMLFLALLGWTVALARAVRRGPGWDEWSDAYDEWAPTAAPGGDEPDEPRAARRPFTSHKLVTSFGLVTVFFAAASFTAVGGDLAAKALDPARCAALIATTGEDDSVCAEFAQQEAAADVVIEAPPESSAPVEEVAPAVDAVPAADAVPAVEAVSEAEADASVPGAPEAESQSVQAEADALTSQVDVPAGTAAPAVEASPEAATGEPEQSVSSHDAAVAPEVADAGSYVLAPEQPTATPSKKTDATRHWVVRRAKESKAKAPAVEHEGGSPTVWLNRALPDPTPPAKRLSPRFAKNLQRIAAVNGVSWSLVLGVLRAEGARDRVPATVRELNALARGLSRRGAADSEWNAVLALSGRTGFADRAVALARYNRVVGLRALVGGLEDEKEALTQRLLDDPRAHIYGPGRDDLEVGKIDVRVVVLVSYLAESYGEVTVSSLFSGHRKYARPGVVSAHVFGHAVDVATVAGTPMEGHQQPGSVTEKAVRSILMLPVELQPRQVISLLGMGGPSFALANHHDHIHVGY